MPFLNIRFAQRRPFQNCSFGELETASQSLRINLCSRLKICGTGRAA
jgi:hypothetical protein